MPTLRYSSRRISLLVVLAFTIGACLWPLSSIDGRVTKANLDKIKRGMSMAEVEQLLGPPKHKNQFMRQVAFLAEPELLQHGLWISGGFVVIINATPGRGVIEKNCAELSRRDQFRYHWAQYVGTKAPF